MGLEPNTLYYGDCLEWLPRFPPKSVDLIYLDPPFNSNTDYNLLFGNGDQKRRGARKSAQVRAFADTWRWDDTAAARVERLTRAAAHPAHKAVVGLRTLIGEGGMLAYLSYMAERLAEMPRVLKPTGAIYLHCDPTASHGLKLVMDTIFGPTAFRNEVVWRRTFAHGGATRWGDIHDTLLFYAASDKHKWNRVEQEYDPIYVREKYRHKDARGRYQQIVMTGPGTSGGDSGRPWHGYDPTEAGRHWAVPRRGLQRLRERGLSVPDRLQDQLDMLLDYDLIYVPRKRDGSTGVPRFKLYLEGGQPIQDIILDIPPINSQAKERLGYPTQKPLKLLERIIEASSDEGDLVLDPFCGCGTAVVAAHKLNRRWAGIDISPFAIDLIASKRFPEFRVPTEGYPYDLAGAAKLAREQPFKFEKWAVTRVPGLAPNDQQVGDGGVDGIGYLLAKPENGATDQVLAQVKGGRYQLGQLRDFMGVLERERAAIGVYTTVEPVSAAGAHVEMAKRGKIRLGATEYPRAQLWSMHDYFDDRMPDLPALADPYTGKPVQTSLGLGL